MTRVSDADIEKIDDLVGSIGLQGVLEGLAELQLELADYHSLDKDRAWEKEGHLRVRRLILKVTRKIGRVPCYRMSWPLRGSVL